MAGEQYIYCLSAQKYNEINVSPSHMMYRASLLDFNFQRLPNVINLLSDSNGRLPSLTCSSDGKRLVVTNGSIIQYSSNADNSNISNITFSPTDNNQAQIYNFSKDWEVQSSHTIYLDTPFGLTSSSDCERIVIETRGNNTSFSVSDMFIFTTSGSNITWQSNELSGTYIPVNEMVTSRQNRISISGDARYALLIQDGTRIVLRGPLSVLSKKLTSFNDHVTGYQYSLQTRTEEYGTEVNEGSNTKRNTYMWGIPI
jgi:hypothetical protein